MTEVPLIAKLGATAILVGVPMYFVGLTMLRGTLAEIVELVGLALVISTIAEAIFWLLLSLWGLI